MGFDLCVFARTLKRLRRSRSALPKYPCKDSVSELKRSLRLSNFSADLALLRTAHTEVTPMLDFRSHVIKQQKNDWLALHHHSSFHCIVSPARNGTS